MSNKMDLTGQTFGRWTVLCEAEPRLNTYGYPIRVWRCQCNCELHTIKDLGQSALTSGRSQSCGCLRKFNKGGKINWEGLEEKML